MIQQSSKTHTEWYLFEVKALKVDPYIHLMRTSSYHQSYPPDEDIKLSSVKDHGLRSYEEESMKLRRAKEACELNSGKRPRSNIPDSPTLGEKIQLI